MDTNIDHTDTDTEDRDTDLHDKQKYLDGAVDVINMHDVGINTEICSNH